jgi:broad specificity phosphatase PhoE
MAEPVVTTRWWWIRHAPVHNPERRLYGQNDLPAICEGNVCFPPLAAALPRNAVWLTSQLQRTRQTAEAVIPHLVGHDAPEFLVEPDIAEQHFGQWQGMTFLELQAHLGDNFADFWRNPAKERPPGGESFADVIARVGRVIERMNRSHAGRDIVAFAHGGSIRAALAHTLGLAPDAALSFQIDNLTLTRLDHVLTHDGSPAPGAMRPWRINLVNWLPR